MTWGDRWLVILAATLVGLALVGLYAFGRRQ